MKACIGPIVKLTEHNNIEMNKILLQEWIFIKSFSVFNKIWVETTADYYDLNEMKWQRLRLLPKPKTISTFLVKFFRLKIYSSTNERTNAQKTSKHFRDKLKKHIWTLLIRQFCTWYFYQAELYIIVPTGPLYSNPTATAPRYYLGR